MSAAPEFLDLLSAEDRDALEQAGHRRRSGASQVLLSLGDPSDCVLVLMSGRVKVTVPTPAGTDAVLTFRSPGALLGEQSLVDGRPRSANVVAVEPVETLVVPTSRMRTLMAQRPGIALTMLQVLSARLRSSDRRLAEFASADALGRVAARLVELCDGHGDPTDANGSVQITLPLTQDELAGWTGSSRAATAQALRTLRTLGWISSGRRSLTVHDLEALRGRAAG